MNVFYSEEEIIQSVGRLTRSRLTTFVQAKHVRPIESDVGARFSQIDLARVELICDLCDDFELDDDAVGLVLSLVDQLHSARAELRALADAIAQQPEDVRKRILSVVVPLDG
jgi:chaperone modulatory protein CbpM